MILIIHKNRKAAEELSDMFYYMGAISTPATPLEGLSIVSMDFHAVLIVAPELLPDTPEYIERLRLYSKNALIYALTDSEDACLSFGFDKVLVNRGYSSGILTEMSEHSRTEGVRIVGSYVFGGIDASCDKRQISFLDKPIPFTMILRYLIATHPNPKSPEDILEFAFRKGKRPEPSAIRTHISIMNRKYKTYTDRVLINSLAKQGYYLAASDLVSEEKEKEAALQSSV